MTRVEQTATAFLVTSLGAAQKHTLQLFNSIEKGRFRVALPYLKRAEHVLAQITPDCASQEWCADFRRGWDFRGLNRLSKWLRGFDSEVLVCVNSYPLFCSHLARMLARVRIPIIEIFHARNWRPTRTGRCG
ncbi:hypothetical protein [Bradyrhizobium sp. CCBAU 11361]|uniref:hypothetical protein n=1 Tax=Bradyrhizobium sp. CCBAU 11361 TaxID=1630812 RepID=UPI002305412E|nr:hypothetical protein [Bradyrhizobium sp. CCBAU 11361]MDA9493650.1 hypothetical protein [Bradyrhizobium sp. CCBAU 11361]